MKAEQQTFKTEDYIGEQEPKSYSSIISKNETDYLKAMIFRQSSRVVYRAVLSFWDVEKYCKHTSVRPKDDEEVLMSLKNIKNRYLEPTHGKEIKLYISENIEDFILPNLTTVIDSTLPIVTDLENPKVMQTEIFEELKKNQGCIFGYIKLPKDTKFTIADGNHRTYALHELIKSNSIDGYIEGLYIGIDFYLEMDVEMEKQLFVDLNSHKPMEPSVMCLLKEKDLISNSVKALLGMKDNGKYPVSPFLYGNNNYIGVDLVKDNISKSNHTISFNIIRNMVSILALDNVDMDKKFNKIYSEERLKYLRFMKKTSTFLNYIFLNCEPFSKIKKDLSNVKELRKEYISMTGAGFYIIAKIGHVGIKYEEIIDIEKLAKAICKLDWKREKNGVMNKIFVGGILTSKGKISNNRTALNTSADRIKQILKLTDEDIKKINS